jgi:hypothetical protein
MLCAAHTALASASNQVLFLPRVEAPVQVDGKLDEPAWQNADSLLATLYLKNTDTVPERPTRVYGAYDRETIYFAWRCEEESPQHVADRRIEHDGYNLWQNDCVEVFLQTGLDPGIFYHAIGDVRGQLWDARQDQEKWDPDPEWSVAAQREGAIWQMEMAFPVASLGLKRARQGNFVRVLFAREDWTFVGGSEKDPKVVRYECWPVVKTRSFNSHASYRRLYFDSDNLLPSLSRDSDGDDVPDGYRFGIRKNYEPYAPADPMTCSIDAKAGVLKILIPPTTENLQLFLDTQAWLHKDQPYRWSFRVAPFDKKIRLWPSSNSKPRVHVQVAGEEDPDGLIPFSTVLTTQDSSRDVLLSLHIDFTPSDKPRQVVLRDMRLERLEGASGLGYKCLTGNASPASANLETGASLSILRGGVDEALTFEGHSRGRDIHLNESPLFDGDPDTVVAFEASSTHSSRYRRGVDLLLDLKQDYFIRGVKLTTKLPDLRRVQLHVKPEKRPDFALVKDFAMENGKPFFLADLDKVDSTARWVRLRVSPNSTFHGRTNRLSELQVWGEPKGEHTDAEINYMPVEGGAVVADRPLPRLIDNPLAPHIYPQPREVRYTEAPFVVPDEPRIVVSPSAGRRDLFAAAEIKRVLQEQYGLDATIIKSDGAADARGAIAIGQLGESPLMQALAKQFSLSPPAGKDAHEGYALRVGPEGVVIAGSDAGGTLYGGLSFCELLHHKDGKAVARGAAVKDWPYIPHRTIQRGLPSRAPGRIAEWKNVVRGLARMRINGMWVNADPIDMPGSLFPHRNHALSLDQMRELTEYAENYNLVLIPMIGVCARFNIGNDPSLYEARPGEDPATIYRKARSCPCPSNPKMYETVDRYLGDVAKVFPNKYWSVGLAHEMFQENNGSRWNVCARCTARKLSDRDLWADFAHKIVALFHKHDRIPMIEGSTSLVHPRLMGALEGANIDWDKAVMHSYGFSSEKEYTKQYLLDLGVKRCMLWYSCAFENDFKQKEIWGDTLPWMTTYTTWKERNHATWKGDEFYMELARHIPLNWNPLAPRGTLLQQERAATELVRRFVAISDRVNYPSQRHDMPDRFTPLDLGPVFNETTIDAKAGDGRGWADRGPNYDLRYMPTGDRVLAGIHFRLPDPRGGKIDTCLSVTKLATSRTEAILPLGRKVDGIVFLHGVLNRNVRPVVLYEFEYSDGEKILTDVWGARSVRAWARKPPTGEPRPRGRGQLVKWDGTDKTWAPDPIGEGLPAWTGMIPSGYVATLYSWEWVNPYPQKTLQAIRIMSPAEQTEDLAMILAATAVDVKGAQEKFFLGSKPVSRRSSGKVTRFASPRGETYDFLGGKIIRKNMEHHECVYEAPDGTKLLSNLYPTTVENAFREESAGENYYEERMHMTFTFPAPRPVSSVVVRTPHGHPEMNELRLFDIEVAVSTDGETFQDVGIARHAGPEVDGLLQFTCDVKDVKGLRLRVSPDPGLKGDMYWETPGVELVQIYK